MHHRKVSLLLPFFFSVGINPATERGSQAGKALELSSQRHERIEAGKPGKVYKFGKNMDLNRLKYVYETIERLRRKKGKIFLTPVRNALLKTETVT